MLFRIVLARALAVILVMVGAATIVFAVLRLSGDPVLLYAAPDTPLATLERIRQELGFDAPMYIQYLRYLGSLARGDLGYSLRWEQPVVRLLLERLPATLALAGAALLLGPGFGGSGGG